MDRGGLMVNVTKHYLGGDWYMLEQDGYDGKKYNIAIRTLSPEKGYRIYGNTAMFLSMGKNFNHVNKTFVQDDVMDELETGVEDYLEFHLIWDNYLL